MQNPDVMCCVTLYLSSLGVRYFSFCFFIAIYLTLEGINLNKLQEGIRGGGGGVGVQLEPSPLLLTPFIRLTRYLARIMSVLCTFNLWFPWQPQQHNDVICGGHLGFSNFQFFSDSYLNTANSEEKHLANGIYKIVRSIARLSVLWRK